MPDDDDDDDDPSVAIFPAAPCPPMSSHRNPLVEASEALCVWTCPYPIDPGQGHRDGTLADLATGPARDQRPETRDQRPETS